MTGAEYLQLVAERLRADGSEVSEVQLPVGTAVVGYQSVFRVHWGGKLHVFTVVVAVPDATVDLLEELARDALSYGTKTKGGFSGFGSGIAAIPVLVGDRLSNEVRDAVQQHPHVRLAAVELPVAVDLQTGARYSYSGVFTTAVPTKNWLRERANAALPLRDAATWTKRGERWYCLRHGLTSCEQCPNRPVST